MEKLQSYEQYSRVLAAFKEGRERCGTNKLMTRDELTALIEAGKLYYEQVGDTLWFFTNEEYFYTGVYYVPVDKAIEMRKQDMDVAVDLMGKGDRYDERRDGELVAAGFEKRDKRLEYAAEPDEIIDDIRRENKVMRAFWERRGFVFRTAKKADYPEMRELLLKIIGRERYTTMALTDAELEDMEQYGRASLACDPKGKAVAVSGYYKSGNVAYPYISATIYPGSGLGACNYFVLIEQMCKEGCKKMLGWAREDNLEGTNLQIRAKQMATGKFYWQFVYCA